MKKALSILLVLIMILSFAACGGGGDTESKDRLAEIQERGYIELATEPYFAPYEFIDPNKSGDDQYVGADIELAKYIADKIGVELKIVPLEYAAVLTGITEGKYDFAISAIAYSPAREEAMNLSDGYYFGGEEENEGYGWICRAEDAEKYQTLESLEEAIVITQSGSVQEAILNEQVKAKEVKLLATMTDCYLAVAEGVADVCICDRGSAKLYADANGGLAVTDYIFEVDPLMNSVVVGMPLKGTDSLEAVVNECIAELTAEGQIDAWFAEYTEYASSLGL